LKDKGISASLAGLREEISERDARDSERKVAPLMPAADAVVVDTSELSIDEVVKQVMALARSRFDVIG
jgi:cytidylate kinase